MDAHMNGKRYTEFETIEDSLVIIQDCESGTGEMAFSIKNYEDFFFSITKITVEHNEKARTFKINIKGSAFLITERSEICVYSPHDRDELIGLIVFKDGKVISQGLKIREEF